MVDTNYQCKFCHHRFVSETRFLKHRCKQMIRDEEFRSPEGQAAWGYYQKWMREYQRFVSNYKSFLQSKYFNSFLKFAKFVKKVRIPDIDVFVRLMKEKDIHPTIWTNDKVYSLYLEYADRKLSPMKHAEITINTLFDYAEDKEVEVVDVFDNITPNEVIHFLRQRRLSPWILLHSDKFRTLYINKTTSEEKVILESIIRPQYWKHKFETQPKTVQIMKKYVSELQL